MYLLNQVMRWFVCVTHCGLSVDHAIRGAAHYGVNAWTIITSTIIVMAIWYEGPELVTQLCAAIKRIGSSRNSGKD